MKNVAQFANPKISFVFTDIDDTLTSDGLLEPEAFQAIWNLYKSRIHVVPVTGRPAGWCELIARQWPVAGVVGENGGFYFRYADREMKRHYFCSPAERAANRAKLDQIQTEILKEVPGAAVASDQFCRQLDLAIDFREDVAPLDDADVQRIVRIFERHGARAKISSIHVNGWFGDYDKLSMCREFFKREFGRDLAAAQTEICFVGDSPNDEPMFEFFENSFAVKNVEQFLPKLKHRPAYLATRKGGAGFAEIAEQILSLRA